MMLQARFKMLDDLGVEPENILLDDGVGFDGKTRAAAGGLGLFHVRERMGWLGGGLEIDSVPGRGTRIGLTVPQALQTQELPARRSSP